MGADTPASTWRAILAAPTLGPAWHVDPQRSVAQCRCQGPGARVAVAPALPIAAPVDGERTGAGLGGVQWRTQRPSRVLAVESVGEGSRRQTRMKVCIVGASGKLGRYMVQHALDRGHDVVAVCRAQSVGKLAEFEDRITVVPGATDDRDVIKRAVAGCDGVLVVLVPRGMNGYSSGTAQAVLDHAQPGARLAFSCGWHITRDGQDVYSWKLKAIVKVFGPLARLARFADLDDQVEACRRIFASDTRWTVVRGSDLEEGESQGLPVWSPHVGDPVLESNITRRVDFALFMVEALENDDLVHEAPAIVGRLSPSALAHASG